MLNLEPLRAARLLMTATRLAALKTATAQRQSEGPLHKIADAHEAKVGVAIRYAFAAARAAMRRKLQSREDVKQATALGIVTLRQELKAILPRYLRKMYVEGGEVGAEILNKQLRTAGDFEGHPFRGNQWTTGEGAAAHFDVPKNFKLEDAQYDVNTKYPRELMVVATVDLDLLSSEYGNDARVREMVDAIKKGAKFPVLTLEQKSKGRLGILDGRTRVAAFREAGLKGKVPAVIRLEDYDTEGALPKGVEIDEERTKSLRSSPRAAEELRTAKRESKPKISFTFDSKQQSAIDWADRHAAELIDGISETSREAINNAVSEFLETGDFSEMRDEILAAVGDERRADLIARNEPMVAVHEGQRAAWDQAVEEGLLPEDAMREWIVVGDDKVCPICEGLEGKTAKLGEEYQDGIEGPPAHVSCRCSESITARRALGDFEGHPFRGNQWTKNPLADELYGEHTPAGQRKLIDYLENATGERFKPHGSVGRGEISKNDFDIIMQPPTEEDLERMSDEANRYESEIRNKVERGEITMDDAMQELYGESSHPIDKALEKIGFKLENSVQFDTTPTGTMGQPEIGVIRYRNEETGHNLEVWMKLLSMKILAVRALGGSGSGNFGHSGRPGHVGGSISNGSTENQDRSNSSKQVQD